MAVRIRSRVFLVDEHSLLRELLAQLLNAQPDVVVCGGAETPAQALTRIRSLKPDLAIINVSFMHFRGIDLIKELRTRQPDLRILVLSSNDEPFVAERALRAGACGYLTKHDNPQKVLSAVHEVLAQRMYVSEQLANLIVQRSLGRPRRGGNVAAPFEALSDRELQVFELIGQGYATRDIAKSLCLGTRTVNTYRSRIKEKLGVKDSAALVRQAIRWSDN